MPNYIRNILKIESTPDKIEEVLKSIQSDTNPDQLLDFNKIIPMPKSLEIPAGSQEDLTQLYMTYINPQVDYYGIQSNNDPIPTIKQNPFLPRYRDDLSKEEIDKLLQRFGNYSEAQCLEIGKQYYDNYLQHGATSWYHWCIDNWGTKWNASDVYLVSDDILVFISAWNHPEPIMQKLSEMFNLNVKLVTIEGGKAVSYEYEEIHLPNYWATYTEAAEAGEAEVMAVEGARGTSHYARHAVVGTGDEAIHLVVLDDPREAPNGSTYTAYGNDEIPNFSEWVKDEENAAWYYEQIFAGNYWTEDAEGNLKEDLAVYSTTRKDGVVLNKVESRMKTKIQHWTAVGTGVGTEMGENGWNGNLEILGDTLIELQFPEGEVTKNEDNKVVIADTVTSATVEEYKGYVKMFYDAYNKAK